MLKIYGAYRALGLTDLSLLQQAALDHCRRAGRPGTSSGTSSWTSTRTRTTVQEYLFFHLAGGNRNLCVVGDDDQALYRFRGSTVENLVDFEARCRHRLGSPRGRSTSARTTGPAGHRGLLLRVHPTHRLAKGPGQAGAYRVEGKRIRADSKDRGPAVVASAPGHPDDVCAEVARLVRALLDAGTVADPNQVAFLYPSLKSKQVGRMIRSWRRRALTCTRPAPGSSSMWPRPGTCSGCFWSSSAART